MRDVIGTDQLSVGSQRAVDLALLPRDFGGPREDRVRAAKALPVALRARGLAAC